MTTSTASPFASLAPAATAVPDDVVQAFLQLAPTDTLVEVGGEVYRFSATGLWANLEYLYVEYTGGGEGATYDYLTPETLIGLALSGHPVYLLRLGESVAS
jgi:CRISPR-associated Cas5-like protein